MIQRSQTNETFDLAEAIAEMFLIEFRGPEPDGKRARQIRDYVTANLPRCLENTPVGEVAFTKYSGKHDYRWEEGGWKCDASITLPEAAFETVEVYYVDEASEDPPSKRVEKFIDHILEALPGLFPAILAGLREYDSDLVDEDGHLPGNLTRPCVMIDNPSPTRSSEWSFTLERPVFPSFGYHIEIEAGAIKDVWAGD